MNAIRATLRRLVPRGVRNWLRSPRSSAAWVWDECKHAIRLDPTVRLRPDWTLRCHPAAYRTAYRALEIDAEQMAELDAFIATCRPRMVLFDLGAHFGLFSLAALHYGGASAQAVAVDPSGMAERMLHIQSRLNGVAERLAVLRAAVSDRAGRLELTPVGVLAAWYYTAPGSDHPPRDRCAVPAVTLDGLAERFRLVPTHVKIDVEGFETAVLRGGKAVLGGTAGPLLFLELHNALQRERRRDPRETLQSLREAGYQVFALDGQLLENEAILTRPLVRVVARRVAV
jgi:FkbM family methyltransferase